MYVLRVSGIWRQVLLHLNDLIISFIKLTLSRNYLPDYVLLYFKSMLISVVYCLMLFAFLLWTLLIFSKNAYLHKQVIPCIWYRMLGCNRVIFKTIFQSFDHFVFDFCLHLKITMSYTKDCCILWNIIKFLTKLNKMKIFAINNSCSFIFLKYLIILLCPSTLTPPFIINHRAMTPIFIERKIKIRIVYWNRKKIVSKPMLTNFTQLTVKCCKRLLFYSSKISRQHY